MQKQLFGFKTAKIVKQRRNNKNTRRIQFRCGGPVKFYSVMRRSLAATMAGIAFTFGVFVGLLIQLPVITLPMNDPLDDGLIVQVDGLQLGHRHDGNNNLIIAKKDISISNDGQGENQNQFQPAGNRKQLSIGNPLSSLKPSRHGVVFSRNNGTSDYLEHNTLQTGRIITDYEDQKQSKDSLQQEGLFKDTQVKITNIGQNVVSPTNFVSGILWTKNAENMCPSGFSNRDHTEWKSKVNSMKIVKMGDGCGRMQNRMLTFRDASKACARYRLNIDQMQGEIYSYYLSKLLKIPNVPPSSLQLLDSKSDLWLSVRPEIANAQWPDDKVIIVTKWIDDLKPSFIPPEFRGEDKTLFPSSVLGQKSKDTVCELLQWSDLIIFDYLTANLDRVVNNMFNKQWNDQMMNSPAHNLERSTSGALVFIDNESGLFHGYRLQDKYSSYHKLLLHSLCIFRESTASEIERLHLSGSIGDELHKLFTDSESFHRYIPKIPRKNVKILQQRLDDVYNQIQQCRTRYS